MPEESAPPDVAPRLLAHLRTSLNQPGLDYASPPQALTGGFDTSVYAFALASSAPPFDIPLVARVFRPQDPDGRVLFEATLQGAIARQGFPAPAVLHLCTDHEPLGAAFFIMERAPGRRLVDYLPTRSLLRVISLLAQTQARLHRLESEPIRASLAAAGARPLHSVPSDALAIFRRDVDAGGLKSFEPALAWLETHSPPLRREVLCHMDFHPLNILADEGRVTGVIDWSNASVGPAAADVGATTVILEMGPLDVPSFARGPVGLFRRWAVRRYTKIYRRLNPVPMEDIRYFEALRCFAAMLAVARLRTQGESARPTGYAWDSPDSIRAMTHRFRDVSGVPLRLPARRPRA